MSRASRYSLTLWERLTVVKYTTNTKETFWSIRRSILGEMFPLYYLHRDVYCTRCERVNTYCDENTLFYSRFCRCVNSVVKVNVFKSMMKREWSVCSVYCLIIVKRFMMFTGGFITYSRSCSDAARLLTRVLTVFLWCYFIKKW